MVGVGSNLEPSEAGTDSFAWNSNKVRQLMMVKY